LNGSIELELDFCSLRSPTDSSFFGFSSFSPQPYLGSGESLEFGSNLTLESVLHFLKQRSPSTSTDDGMQIDESDEHFENAPDSIRESLEPDSNVTLQSPSHFKTRANPIPIAQTG
jgi:hypothetical protein